jgi:hypothetical protein
VPYTLSGISTEDVLGNLLSGNAVVNSSGVATISVTLLSDLLTEGAETLTVAAGGTSASTLVNDTSKAVTPTYLIFTNNSTANEGDTINFELRTSGVPAGTEIPYSISIQQAGGVAYSDPSKDVMGGVLSGKVTINANGQGVISVGLTNDNQTEGYENLSISAAGATSQIRISDTSLTVPTASTRTVNEGQSFTVYLSNSSYFPGAALTVKATGTGITSNDLGSLITYVVINSNSVAATTFNVIADKLTEGTETVLIQFSNGDQLLSSPISIEILDTSQSATTYSLTPSSSSVNEGSTATFTLSTTNVTAGTSVLYTLSGVSAADVTGGALSGNAVIDSSGSATISVALVNDSLTEGSETLTVTAGGATASTVVNDTSKAAATYTLTPGSSSVNEGSTATFTLSTTNVTAGTSVLYTLSGVSAADVTGGALSGNAVIDSSGSATISVALVNDSLTEGSETLTVTAGGATASTVVNDTSKAAATYTLTPGSSSVNEGSTATFTLSTTNVTAGTSVLYTLSGVSAADVTGGALSGNAVIDSSGSATISVALVNDSLTEGSETLTVTAGGATASTVVNDTSKAAATYTLTPGSSSVNEGSTATFTLSTTNVTAGTSVLYTLSGVSAADVTGGALFGTVIISSNGNAAINIPIASDLTTEGTESLTVTAQLATAISSSVLISDTSKTPVVEGLVTSIPYGDGKYFYGSSSPDNVTGTSFLDVVKQPSTFASNQLTKLSDGSWQVQNKITPSNSDNLVNVERLEFSDMNVALDVSGPAGQVAKILGSVFGPSYVNNKAFVGIGLAYLDAGMSYLDLCGLAASFAGLTTPDLLVTTLLRNTTGTEPTALNKSSYLQSIANGASYASIVQQIADSSANSQSIKLPDLGNTGLAYTPHVFLPTYSLSAASSSVNEGSSAVFNLTTTKVAVGTEVSYTLSGVSASDLTAGSLTGKVTIGAGGKASISIPVAMDSVTEGPETLAIKVQDATPCPTSACVRQIGVLD